MTKFENLIINSKESNFKKILSEYALQIPYENMPEGKVEKWELIEYIMGYDVLKDKFFVHHTNGKDLKWITYKESKKLAENRGIFDLIYLGGIRYRQRNIIKNPEFMTLDTNKKKEVLFRIKSDTLKGDK